VYGSGPVDRPYLMQRGRPARLLVGGTPDAPDLPRNQEGVALLGDPRNDVHALISQLHVRMLGVHNAIEAQLEGVAAEDRFAAVRQELRWHYQWAVLHEYLDLTVGAELAAEVRAEGARWFTPEGPVRLPVEFADAAFRYGHGQVRERYQLQPGGPAICLFPDLVGFRAIEDRRVDLALLFDLPGRPPSPQRCKRLDGRLAASLIRLPVEITGELDDAVSHHQSLAVRDLQRGVATGLPSGEAVARHLGVEPLDADEVGVAEHGWEGETPLWFYILKEAELRAGGRHLGPVGGRIVAEVMVTVLDRDPTSFRAVRPDWTADASVRRRVRARRPPRVRRLSPGRTTAGARPPRHPQPGGPPPLPLPLSLHGLSFSGLPACSGAGACGAAPGPAAVPAPRRAGAGAGAAAGVRPDGARDGAERTARAWTSGGRGRAPGRRAYRCGHAGARLVDAGWCEARLRGRAGAEPSALAARAPRDRSVRCAPEASRRSSPSGGLRASGLGCRPRPRSSSSRPERRARVVLGPAPRAAPP
jgi:hypothetical protein